MTYINKNVSALTMLSDECIFWSTLSATKGALFVVVQRAIIFIDVVGVQASEFNSKDNVDQKCMMLY